ncbi:hypothetical protein T265_06212 [Opisthorchis viverrini]|uniref:ER lumen protein-retaining receptor n=1 Tax=Opisthorchis viverrini TaxID=6198 RepID=A0A075AE90_OPIVI|nr:hypothetical protein T265_06212 [Opisthorchis viverrini]KER26569.1 hypothetical protein T265_06212 [Opisthorchis viverrini]
MVASFKRAKSAFPVRLLYKHSWVVVRTIDFLDYAIFEHLLYPFMTPAVDGAVADGSRLSNLVVFQPSCFLLVKWQLGTERLLQLNEFYDEIDDSDKLGLWFSVLLLLYSERKRSLFNYNILLMPSCCFARRKHEGWDTATLPKHRQKQSRFLSCVQTTSSLPSTVGKSFSCSTQAAKPHEGGTRAEILSGRPSLDRGSREAEILWAFSIYLESVAIMPQLFMISKTGEAETITSHYLFALGAYRALYLLNWAYRYVVESHLDHIALIAGIVQTLLYCDFFYLYITKGAFDLLLISHQLILWAFSIYLESVAIMPQLFMISKTGEAETITSHYLFALGAYRALYLLNWAYRYVVESHLDHIALIAGIVQTLLYCDFFYLYITKGGLGSGARRPKWLERKFTDSEVRGSNPTSASRLPLSRPGQPGSIPALVQPSGDMTFRHRKGATAERFS